MSGTEHEEGDSVLDLVDECLAILESGGALAVTSLKERAGALWPDVARCVNIALDLDAASLLLSDESPDHPLPERIGRFEVLRLLGEGGFSRVYQAIDEELGRSVALKVLHQSASAEDSHQRTTVEGQALAQVDHPSVLRVFEIFSTDESYVVVTEYVPGPTLARVLGALQSEDREGLADDLRQAVDALASPEERLQIGLMMAGALAACHGKGVIHRDLKPANVLLPAPLLPKIIDFGISHAGGAGFGVTEGLVGTFAYLAPEQLTSGRTGASVRSEIYSLAVLIFEVVTLKHPWEGDAPAHDQPPPSMVGLPLSLAQTLTRALQPRPEDRYPTMQSFESDLRRAAGGESPEMSMPRVKGAFRAASRGFSRRPFLVLALLVLAAGLLAVMVAGIRVSQLMDERKSLATELTSIEAGLATADEPVELLGALDVLDRWEHDARALDEARLAKLALDPLSGSVRSARELVWERIDERIAVETQEALGDVGRAAAGGLVDEIFFRWSELVLRCRPKERLQRCEMRVPPGHQVLQIGGGPNPALMPVDSLLSVPAGRYRIRDSRSGAEVEAEVQPGQLVATVQAQPGSDELWSEAVTVRYRWTGDAEQPPEDRAFQIMPRSIAYADLNSFFSADEIESLRDFVALAAPSKPRASADELRGLSFTQASILATRLGGRMPTVEELRQARESRVFSEEEKPGNGSLIWSTMTASVLGRRFTVFMQSPRPPGKPKPLETREHGSRGPVATAELRLVRTIR